MVMVSVISVRAQEKCLEVGNVTYVMEQEPAITVKVLAKLRLVTFPLGSLCLNNSPDKEGRNKKNHLR